MANVSVAFHVAAMNTGERYEIFFDEHLIFGPRAKAWYPLMVSMQAEVIQAVMPVEPLFRTDLDALPLQAADITAWIARRGKTTGLGELSWIKEELSGVISSTISQIVDERWITGVDEPLFDADELAQYGERFRETLRAYQETFGHEFPPKNKLERKRMQGRK